MNVTLAAERFGYCGVVRAYVAPTQTQEGSVTVGSRTFRIASGVIVGGTHPIEVGTKRCIQGDRDAPDRFTSLTAEATLLESFCGTVSEFRPATSGALGSLVLNGFRFVLIREGTTLPADSASGHRCFTSTQTSAGDALITGRTDLPAGQAAAPAAPPAPAAPRAPIVALPATSTSVSDAPTLAVALFVAIALAAITVRARVSRSP